MKTSGGCGWRRALGAVGAAEWQALPLNRGFHILEASFHLSCVCPESTPAENQEIHFCTKIVPAKPQVDWNFLNKIFPYHGLNSNSLNDSCISNNEPYPTC